MTDPRSLAEEYLREHMVDGDRMPCIPTYDMEVYLAGFKAALASEEVKGLVKELDYMLSQHFGEYELLNKDDEFYCCAEALEAFRSLESEK